jgi:hypothetical protein
MSLRALADALPCGPFIDSSRTANMQQLTFVLGVVD